MLSPTTQRNLNFLKTVSYSMNEPPPLRNPFSQAARTRTRCGAGTGLRGATTPLVMLQPVRLYAFLLEFLALLLRRSKKVSLIISKSLIFIQGKLIAPADGAGGPEPMPAYYGLRG
jgi:hypothetical protein